MTELEALKHQPHLSREDERHMNNLGMWLFLASEVMLFGGLFTAYLIYRYTYPQVFVEASRHLDVVLGAINTAILLTSSLTMALAVNSIQRGLRRSLIAFLLITVLLGLVFVGIKGSEYLHTIQEGLFPGQNFLFEGPHAREARLFFSLYYTMTGLHAAHMLIGIAAMLLLAFLAWRHKFSAENHDVIEMMGLYWHFVDVVWIFLFPLLYLVDRTL